MYTDLTNALLNKAPQTGQTRQQAAAPAQSANVVELKPDAAKQASTELSSKDMQELESAVENLNQALQNIKRELQFSVDDDTGRTVVKVINADTDEVVRQIPSEELLNALRHMQQQGLLLDAEV